MSIRPYRTLDNKIDGAVMALFDVTDRKANTEARYRRLFETARDGILILDGDTGAVVDLNPAATALTGYSRSELVGRRLWDAGIFSPEDLQDMATCLAAHETWQRHLTIASPTHQRREVDVVATAYQEDGRRVLQISFRAGNNQGSPNAAQP